jgi:STIP1 family protein 1
MARLKMGMWDNAIADCTECLRLAPDSMKAHYSLSQAHLALHAYDDALQHALAAHALCVKAADKSLGTITTHVLRCKKERWDDLEKRRVRETSGLEAEVLGLLERERDEALREVGEGDEGTRREVEEEWRGKIERMREVFEKARPKEEKRRQVPDWAIDDISFCVMVDPVIVSTGISVGLLLRRAILIPLADKNRQVLRARLHHRASPPATPRSSDEGTAVPVRAEAEPRSEAGM